MINISRRYALKSFLSLISYVSLSKVTFGNNQILAGKNVIVIGAGISGLVAASTLIQNGANVIILEAKDHIGGRIRTDRSLGIPFEYGAGWIHGPSKDNPIRNLADRTNSSLFVTDDDSCELLNLSGNDIDEKVWNEIEKIWEEILEQDRNLPLLVEKIEEQFIECPEEKLAGNYFGCDVYYNHTLNSTKCPRDDGLIKTTMMIGEKRRDITYR